MADTMTRIEFEDAVRAILTQVRDAPLHPHERLWFGDSPALGVDPEDATVQIGNLMWVGLGPDWLTTWNQSELDWLRSQFTVHSYRPLFPVNDSTE